MKRLNAMKTSSAILLAMVVFIAFFGCDNVSLNHAGMDEKSTQKNLEKYDYIFRVVDISNDNKGRFVQKINAHEDKLEQLASVFADIKAKDSPNRSTNSANPIINNLARTAFTAYTTPEVLDLVTQLASEDIYIQFSYKEFLIEQCEPYNVDRSLATTFSKRTKNVLEFDGSNISPSQWLPKKETITFVGTAGSVRALEDAGSDLITLNIAPENKVIVDEYMEEYSEILLADKNSIITEQPDGNYVIVNGYTETVIETTNANVSASMNRGLLSSLKKAVSKIVTTIKSNPVGIIGAAVCTVVAAASGAGLITLPAWLAVSGGELTGSIAIVFLL
jgi:Txe/YoeB family toxin of Txe-Axe toxin-antitoxin module